MYYSNNSNWNTNYNKNNKQKINKMTKAQIKMENTKIKL